MTVASGAVALHSTKYEPLISAAGGYYMALIASAIAGGSEQVGAPESANSLIPVSLLPAAVLFVDEIP